MQANADPASTGSNKVQISGHSDMLPKQNLPRHGTAVAHQENMNTSSNEDKHLESETDVDNKSVNTKLAVLKNFHVALVEFVKELLRPTWNLGLLSKVAYKKIVKKTVNMVENSLNLNQIPNTAESTEEYFDLSLTKLSNTIEVRHKKFVCPLNSIVHNLTSNFFCRGTWKNMERSNELYAE